MPHEPRPWYRPSRNTWYAEVDKRQHRLGQHPEGHPPPKKRKGEWSPPQLILDPFYKLMADQSGRPAQENRPAALPSEAAAAVVERLLTWCSTHRAAETYEWYRWRLQRFLDSLPSKAIPAGQLRHFHLDGLLEWHPGWASGTGHGVCRAVMRCYRWAKKGVCCYIRYKSRYP